MKTVPSKILFRSALFSPALVLLLILAGCNVSGVPSSSSNTSTGSPNSTSPSVAPTRNDPSNLNNTNNTNNPGNPSPTDAPGAGVAKIERALSSNPAVTFRYAGVDFTVKKALITNELPHFQGHYSDTDATIYLTLSGSNESKDYARITSGLLVLTLDGNQYKQPLGTGIQSRDTQSADFEWDNVPLATDWKGATLNINEEDKEPVTVALDNPQPSKYPIKLTPGADAVAGSIPITYSVSLAQMSLDGIGADSQMGQVATDMRFVIVNFTATNQSSNRDAYLGPEDVALLADNKPVRSDWMAPRS